MGMNIDEAGHDHEVGDAAHALLQHLVSQLERLLEGGVGVGDQCTDRCDPYLPIELLGVLILILTGIQSFY